MIGRAATKLPERQQAAAQERDAVGQDRHEEAGAAAHGPAGEHGLEEGLDEVGPQGRQSRRRSGRRSPRGWASAPPARRSRRWRPPTGTGGRRRTPRPRQGRAGAGGRGRAARPRPARRPSSQAASHRPSHLQPEAGSGGTGDARAVDLVEQRRRSPAATRPHDQPDPAQVRGCRRRRWRGSRRPG